VGVKRPECHARFAGDLAHGGAVKALRQEEAVGGGDDLGAGARGVGFDL